MLDTEQLSGLYCKFPKPKIVVRFHSGLRKKRISVRFFVSLSSFLCVQPFDRSLSGPGFEIAVESDFAGETRFFADLRQTHIGVLVEQMLGVTDAVTVHIFNK